MTRVSTGSGNTDDYASDDDASAAAQRLADERLQKLLAEDFDHVPCPNCGNYQPDMCEELRELACDPARKRSNALIGLTGVCFFIAVGVLFPGPQRDGLGVLQLPAMILGFLLIVPAVIARQRYTDKRDTYDANAGPSEERFKIARKHALTAKQMLAQLGADTETKPWQRDAE